MLPTAPDPRSADERTRRAPVVEVLGQTMALHDPARDRFITPSLVHNRCFEPFLTELVVNTVRPGDTALDLGAHIGYYTLLLARLVGPGGRVAALEPDPDNFALLRHNVALNGHAHVDVFPVAASNTPGRAALYRSAHNAGDHRLYPSAEEQDRLAVEVEAVPVDHLFRQRASGIDFAKIDVQGFEGAALEGMTALLGRSPRVTMLVEFWPFGLARAGFGAARLLDLLAALAFRVYEADETALAVRKADPARLLAEYPVDREDRFTNLWCVKAPLAAAPARRAP